MATYYADFDLATGTNAGTSWANAWKTMADAIAGSNGTPPAAGDTILCRGTDTLAATVTNNLAGNETAGLIKWIGVNASGNNDGTRTTLQAGGAYSPLTQTGILNLYENFAFIGSTNTYGVTGTAGRNVYINCSFHTNGNHGYNGGSMQSCWFIRCTFYSNSVHGYRAGDYDRLLFCSAHDNTQEGFSCSMTSGVFIGCIAYSNTLANFGTIAAGTLLFNCVVDSGVDDGVARNNAASMYIAGIIGCRITNHSGAGDIGLNANGEITLYGWNYISNNADTIAPGAADLTYALTNNGSATNTLSGDGASVGDTNEGYTDNSPVADDYNLRSDATLRRTAITIPTS